MVYRRLMAEYHPDKVAHLGLELRALARLSQFLTRNLRK
jgi:DnaJ-domain-containing protein 1